MNWFFRLKQPDNLSLGDGDFRMNHIPAFDEVSGNRSAPIISILYHGTSLLNLVSILRDGHLLTSTHYSADDDVVGVPTTEDPKVGSWFGVNSTKVWFETNQFALPTALSEAVEDALYDGPCTCFAGAVLELSRVALARSYELRPVQIENRDGLDERELRIVTDKSLSISFVGSITVQAAEVEFFADLLRDYPEAGWGSETPEDILSLLAHPLVRVAHDLAALPAPRSLIAGSCHT